MVGKVSVCLWWGGGTPVSTRSARPYVHHHHHHHHHHHLIPLLPPPPPPPFHGTWSLQFNGCHFRNDSPYSPSCSFFLHRLTPVGFRSFSVQSDYLNFGLPAWPCVVPRLNFLCLWTWMIILVKCCDILKVVQRRPTTRYVGITCFVTVMLWRPKSCISEHCAL